MEQVPISRSWKTFHGDVFQGRPRPLILSPMRRALFDNLHSLSHPGIKASRRPNGISGPIWNATSQRWPVLVTTVSSRQFSGMLRPRCTPFHCLTVVLTVFILTLLVLYLHPRAIPTYSLAPIGTPAGQRRCRWPMPPLSPAPQLSCLDGSRALVYRRQSSPIEDSS